MEEESPKPASESAQGTWNRRQSRARRPKSTRHLQDGLLEEAPEKERWSREARSPRIKKMRAQEEHFDRLEMGLVLEVHRRTCGVRLPQGEVVCRYRATVLQELQMFPAVGDRITVGFADDSSEWFLVGIESRRSLLTRPGPEGRENQKLVLAANVDQVVVVISAAAPLFNYGFLDRFLLAASLCDLPLVVVSNKMDLVHGLPPELEDFQPLVSKIVGVSCATGQGIAELQSLLQNKASVFSGQSGVGKSSLANQLVPGLDLATGEIRERDGKGRHTTSSSQLVNLPHGGWIVDTPGIRGLGLVDLPQAELATEFPGFFPEGLVTCRFRDCLHLEEPGCAVLRAVDDGTLSLDRYHSYVRILRSTPQ